MNNVYNIQKSKNNRVCVCVRETSIKLIEKFILQLKQVPVIEVTSLSWEKQERDLYLSIW